MTDTTDPQPLRIPIGRNVTYAVRGMPKVANQYGPGFLLPTEVSLTYRATEDSQLGRFHAYVKGHWLRDGEQVPSGEKLPGQHYYGDPAGWPDWLAAEARLHDPDAAAPSAAADRATMLREAATDAERDDAYFGVYGPRVGAWLRRKAEQEPTPTAAAAAPVKQRDDLTEAEWAEQERARFERLYTRETVRADQAEARAAAMERAMESTAADALKHLGCHRDLMGQCLRAEKAEAAVARVRSVLESEAVVGRSALDYRGLITTALMADDAPGPSRVASEAPGPWLVHKICCGRDDGKVELATWEEADRFREEYIDSARIASHERSAIVRAAPADRAALSARLWAVAEHRIVAEWICCEPINPKHDLCVQGDATLRMVKALLVDDPEAIRPAPLLDAVLAVLPEPAGRAAIYREVADRLAADAERGEKEGLTRIYRRSAARQVREWADEAQQPACPIPESHNWGCGCPGDRLPLYSDRGVDTPGCDCGHNGMGMRWHDGSGCAWFKQLTEEGRRLLAADDGDEAQQPETQAFVCKCPAELCHCGHHTAVSQPDEEA